MTGSAPPPGLASRRPSGHTRAARFSVGSGHPCFPGGERGRRACGRRSVQNPGRAPRRVKSGWVSGHRGRGEAGERQALWPSRQSRCRSDIRRLSGNGPAGRRSRGIPPRLPSGSRRRELHRHARLAGAGVSARAWRAAPGCAGCEEAPLEAQPGQRRSEGPCRFPSAWSRQFQSWLSGGPGMVPPAGLSDR